MASRNAPAKHEGPRRQAAGDERRTAGDRPAPHGTSGVFSGLSGAARDGLALAWAVAASIILLVMAFNVLTRAHEVPEQGVLWPLLDEASSAAVNLVTALMPLGLALWTVRRKPSFGRAALAWAGGAVGYAALHIGGFVALRSLAYPPLLGRPYSFGPLPSEIVYEASKDVPAFALGGLIAWLIFRWRLGAPEPTAPGGAGDLLDIRDGPRLIRTPFAEVLAARSAGNYVEFLLSDGRRPLMRTSLAAQAEQLAAHGFVRTHRSWLVNTARVTGLRPDGSGDYTVELGTEAVPLSRRFRDALEAIRG